MATTKSELARVIVDGPAIPKPGGPQSKPWSYPPFWSLVATAPMFGLDRVEPDPREALQEDSIHPVRTLLLQPSGPADAFRRPRLLALHLIAGQPKESAYGQKGAAGEPTEEALQIRLKGDLTDPVISKAFGNGGDLRFSTLDGGGPGFQQVLVQPAAGAWPNDSDRVIDIPAFQLVTGAIDLAFSADAFKWLGDLHPGQASRLRLTPDGIELEAGVPFPGTGDAKHQGIFLLTRDADGHLLRLLPERLDASRRQHWLDLWNALQDSPERGFPGVALKLRRQGLPPAFAWRLAVADEKFRLPAEVEVPGEAIDLRLLSPRGPRGIDGEVTIKPRKLRLATGPNGKGLQLEASLAAESTAPGEAPPPPRHILRLVAAAGGRLEVGLEKGSPSQAGYPLAHDERRLAAALRKAYGFAELKPGRPDPERATIDGFVPLEDGWLQVPFPNLPPPDPENDSELLGALPIKISNVLSGFLRFAQAGNPPPVLSAFRDEKRPLEIDEAPWVITVEGAGAVTASIAFDQNFRPTAARVDLGDPELSTRGLFWLSEDRPDALEALPRLGAGAGAFLDLPLETLDTEKRPVVLLALEDLKLSVTEGQPGESDRVGRRTLDLSLAWNTQAKDAAVKGPETEIRPAIVWRRHRTMPLAAAMPMTRAASSAVRPLESRDLVPFVIEPGPATKEKTHQLFRLQWQSLAFPEVRAANGEAVKVSPVAAWPWPKPASPVESGIALAAFGVPGAELAFTSPTGATPKPWEKLTFALRYDLPVLDQAFATAELPPLPPEANLTEEREAPPPEPVPTALDWPRLAKFWQDQDRRHQNARVAHGYLAGFNALGSHQAAVADLLGGAAWNTTIGFRSDSATALPYGQAELAGRFTQANQALLGWSGKLGLDGNSLQEGGPIEVVGYAPASFEEGGFLMDSRRAGSKGMKKAGGMFWRPLDHKGKKADVSPTIGIATLESPLEVKAGNEKYRFWFKDLPIGPDGELAAPESGIDFLAWQDGRLQQAGLEWRFFPAEPDAASFRQGLDRMPFFAFELEPLRLRACRLQLSAGTGGKQPTGRVETATLLARLHLPPSQDGPEPGGNLVEILLTAGGAGRDLAIASMETKSPLRFVHRSGDWRIELKAGCRWLGQPELEGATLGLSAFGNEIALSAPRATFPGGLELEWSPARKPELAQGEGQLRIKKATVRYPAPGQSDAVKLELGREVAIVPGPSDPATGLGFAPLRIDMEGPRVQGIRLLGLDANVSATVTEDEGALTITAEAADLDTGSLLRGLQKGKARLTLGLIARLGPFKEGVAPLSAGSFEGEMIFEGSASEDSNSLPTSALADLQRIRFDAARNSRSGPAGPLPVWDGGLTFFGRLEIENTIHWPLISSADSDIPFPGPKPKGLAATASLGPIEVEISLEWPLGKNSGSSKKLPEPARNGRTEIEIDPARRHRHWVTYLLDGQQMPFAVATVVAVGGLGVWAVPVVAKHRLVAADGELAFTAIETIALGGAEALIPPVSQDAGDAFDFDPKTFAARYAFRIQKGEVSNKKVPGMVGPGTGRLATVLQGAAGAGFRAAFWENPNRPGLLLAGGFAGLLAEADGDRFPLLRLPVLAAFDLQTDLGPFGQNGSKKVEVAWADGGAAREVVATLRQAVAPASTSEAALRDALIAGSRRPPERKEEGRILAGSLAASDAAFALLVEQSFAVPCDPVRPIVAAGLDAPFFIAAAVSVSRLLGERIPAAPQVLSFLAGEGLVRYFDRGQERARSPFGLAAALLSRHLEVPARGEIDAPLRPAVLMTLGEDLVVTPWTGPLVEELGESLPIGLTAGIAYAEHAQPRAALLRETGGKYHLVQLPRRKPRPREAPAVTNPAFAGAGRGYPWPLGEQTADSRRWLPGPEESAIRAFRDSDPVADSEGNGPSGIAGLSRDLRLPAHAAGPDAVQVWFAQTRAPIYLPLALKAVEAPPIPWLSPAMARPRLPADSLLEAKLVEAPAGQAILPEAATLASVGDRAGISLARISRFETPLGSERAFDVFYPRFGRPAQGGSASVRTERTPRPGPLPPNTGDPLRDRRPCASPILPARPLELLAGTADTVRGEAGGTKDVEIGAWSVTLVAAPQWESRVTPAWDGTLPIYAEVVVALRQQEPAPPESDELTQEKPPTKIEEAEPGDPAETLAQLIFEGGPEKVAAQAALVIGSASIPFVRLHFPPHQCRQPCWQKISASGEKPTKEMPQTAWRAVVGLVLDARPDDSSDRPGAPFAPIAAAFEAGAPLPPVEARLLLHPSSSRDPIAGWTKPALTIHDPRTPLLPSGADRAPVTLRLPLFPVLPNRGALPLAPTSILFVDPAYDAGLASAPVEDRKRVATTPAVQADRGALTLGLLADRRQINLRESITLMIDLAFEMKLDDFARLLAEKDQADGDLIGQQDIRFELKIELQPRSGTKRPLAFAEPSPIPIGGFKAPAPQLELAKVYELPLKQLVEGDGTAARLEAGDVLVLEVSAPEKDRPLVRLWKEPPVALLGALARKIAFVLTEVPAIAPPPALYAALVLRKGSESRLSLPLHAQSPLPWRIDLRNAKADFRAGLMRRSATFVWLLTRPKEEADSTRVFVAKVDRNGQGYLPESEHELGVPRRLERAP